MKYIATSLSPDDDYHDDYFGEEVLIMKFPYARLFGDFRIFNGLSIQAMDFYLEKIVEAFNNIKSLQMHNNRLKELVKVNGEAKK